jgi:hypothetical protein
MISKFSNKPRRSTRPIVQRLPHGVLSYCEPRLPWPALSYSPPWFAAGFGVAICLVADCLV